MSNLKIFWESGDKVEVNITEDMFWASKITSGVRMYSYVVIGSKKYYLEGSL